MEEIFELIKTELRNLKLDKKEKFTMTKDEMRNFSIKLIDVASQKLGKKENVYAKNLFKANVKLMDKYKKTYEDIQFIIDYHLGKINVNANADKFETIIKKYEGKPVFRKDDE